MNISLENDFLRFFATQQDFKSAQVFLIEEGLSRRIALVFYAYFNSI